MEMVLHVALALLIAGAATVRSEPGAEKSDLESESSRQKIYEIISSHEDRKYGAHGGHEYEEGEVPKKAKSRKHRRYGYRPDEANYYYLDQQHQPKQSGYLPKSPVGDNLYVLSDSKAGYPVAKSRYPAAESAYVDPKKEYAHYDDAYVVHKRPEPAAYVDPKKEYAHYDDAYVVHKRPESAYVDPKKEYAHYEDAYGAPERPKTVLTKDYVYPDHAGEYVEDKTAPITIGKTAHTVYPKPRINPHYPAAAEAKHPSEYVVLEGQQPPRPLILDPKLKATYQHSHQPEAHYSSPHHQVVLKPEVSIPVHYPAPVKDYGHYGGHHHAVDKGHHASGHGYYGDNAVKKESGHKTHGHHDVSGHKAHSSVGAHHDEHGRHHNKGLYERDRGYHYEKAYAYDRIRAHHDIGSNHGAHSSYGAHKGQEAHKDAGHHGADHYSYFKKDDHGAGYGYHDGNSLYKKGGQYGQKYIPAYYHG